MCAGAQCPQIIGDTALGLHALHHATPAIIHRDIKVRARAPWSASPVQPENVLLSQGDTSFKLCDFGSATTLAVTPGMDAPVGIVEEELEKFTTLQVCTQPRHPPATDARSSAHQRWSTSISGTPSTPRLTFGFA